MTQPLAEGEVALKRTCSEEDCDSEAVARGLCRRCYNRHLYHGTLPETWEKPPGRWGPFRDGLQKCSYETCDRVAEMADHGLCNAHYKQKYVRGIELQPLGRRTSRTRAERLLERREIDPETGCWHWMGCKNSEGRGHLRWQGKMEQAHRMAYEEWVGPIESDTVHHKCATKDCFNPDHLERATLRENGLEMHERTSLKRRIVELESEVERLRARVVELEGSNGWMVDERLQPNHLTAYLP